MTISKITFLKKGLKKIGAEVIPVIHKIITQVARIRLSFRALFLPTRKFFRKKVGSPGAKLPAKYFDIQDAKTFP